MAADLQAYGAPVESVILNGLVGRLWDLSGDRVRHEMRVASVR